MTFDLSAKCCDGISRRDVLRAGLGGAGALSLPNLLRLQAASADSGTEQRHTAVIFVAMGGGATQHETYDPKPDAPLEYRGPFHSIDTVLPGVQFSEFMAKQAGVLDRMALLRAVHHESGSHTVATHLVQTGYYLSDPSNVENEMPCIGSVIARVRGASSPALPPFVSIPGRLRYGRAGWFGKSYNPFETVRSPAEKNFQVPNLNLVDGIDSRRLGDRRQLLSAFDAQRRIVDNRGFAKAADDFTVKAFDMITSDRARVAFDLSREDEKTREAYGQNAFGQSLLLARRLVEHGVTFATATSGGWDNHGAKVCGFTLEDNLKNRGPAHDQGLAALVTDLYERGLDKDVLLVVMGEFGRTPKMNDQAGRDHWSPVMSVLMSGGGLQVGQVIGSSDSKGGYPVSGAYRPENVLAMIYRHLGIDPSLKFPDPAGRPRYILERRELISELL